MALSKSVRMQILLAIDVAFFLLELVAGTFYSRVGRTALLTFHAGYAFHSLALVADSFHMVNLLRIRKPATADSGMIVERCTVVMRRSLGGSGCWETNEFKNIHIWGTLSHVRVSKAV